MKYDQFIYHNDEYTLIDFDYFALAETSYDLGKFCAYLIPARVGENIGRYSGGINDPALNTMFMASPDHKANILGPYGFVATAWAVRAAGVACIAVEFG